MVSENMVEIFFIAWKRSITGRADNAVCHDLDWEPCYKMKKRLPEPLGNLVPVDHIPPRCDVVSTLVLVLQIICMFPYVKAQ